MTEKLPFPISYTSEKAFAVNARSQDYLVESGKQNKISEIFWAYKHVGDLVPHTEESLWSGHFFPWIESYHELQVSFSLCMLSFYKQALTSLRSALETGLLSVYWNLNDDGHETIRQWLNSGEATPRFRDIWGLLSSHANFKFFQNQLDLKKQLFELRVLHDYVHTKGRAYSNSMGIRNSNFPTFENRAFQIWLDKFESVVKVLTTCHLIKYPIGLVELPTYEKFGINKPLLGLLEKHQQNSLRKVIGKKASDLISTIATIDPRANSIIRYVQLRPDLSKEEISEQMLDFDKFEISGGGYAAWAKEQRVIRKMLNKKAKAKLDENMIKLEAWARENGHFGEDKKEKLTVKSS